MEKRKERLNFDILNIVSCIAVIGMHHNSIVHQYCLSGIWVQALVAEVIFYFAVPCFFMMSGAKLLTYRERYSTKIFLLKRIEKLMVPYVFWSSALIVMDVILGDGSAINEYSLKGWLNSLINYKVAGTYYFFPALLSMYLVMPVISLLIDSREVLWYIVITTFIMQSLFPVLFKWGGVKWNEIWGNGFTIRVLYIVLGYLLSTERLNRKQRLIIYALGVFGAVFRFLYIFFVSISAERLDQTFFNSSLFPGVLLSVAVFVFFNNISMEKIEKKTIRWIKEFSGATFGIYILHNTLIMPIEQRIFHLDATSVLWRTVFIFITYILTFVVVAVIRRIPVLNKLVP